MQQLKEKVTTLEAEKTSWDTAKSKMETELAVVSTVIAVSDEQIKPNHTADRAIQG